MRKSDIFSLFFVAGLFGFLLTVIDAAVRSGAASVVLEQRTELVKQLTLTDLALFTEARYTRHLTQADLHTGFQDHPMSMEHFPSGSLYLPPGVIEQNR